MTDPMMPTASEWVATLQKAAGVGSTILESQSILRGGKLPPKPEGVRKSSVTRVDITGKGHYNFNPPIKKGGTHDPHR